MLTCPPLTPAPRRRKSMKIKQPTNISNLPPPPPLIPSPGLLANDPEPRWKAETKKKWREVDENEIIHELDPDLERFTHLNWNSICTFLRRWPVQNLFNFYYSDDVCNLIGRIAKTIMKNQKNRFEINYGFGFVLKNIETGEFRYYHASNNSLMLDTAVLISNEAELNENFCENRWRRFFGFYFQTRAHMTEISSFAVINKFFLRGDIQNKILAKRKRSFLHVYVKPCKNRYVVLSR